MNDKTTSISTGEDREQLPNLRLGRGRCNTSSSDLLHAKGLQQPTLSRRCPQHVSDWQMANIDRFWPILFLSVVSVVYWAVWQLSPFSRLGPNMCDLSRQKNAWEERSFKICKCPFGFGLAMGDMLAMYTGHVGHVYWPCWLRLRELPHPMVLVSVKSVSASTWMAREGCFCPIVLYSVMLPGHRQSWTGIPTMLSLQLGHYMTLLFFQYWNQNQSRATWIKWVWHNDTLCNWNPELSRTHSQSSDVQCVQAQTTFHCRHAAQD